MLILASSCVERAVQRKTPNLLSKAALIAFLLAYIGLFGLLFLGSATYAYTQRVEQVRPLRPDTNWLTPLCRRLS